jgi:hypothetical protein
MIQCRLRVAKWLSTTPVLGVCTVCSQEFKVPMSALKRVVDAQASLQVQFDSHQCEPEDMSRGTVRGPADVRLREDPEEDEEEDDPKKNEEDDDDDQDDDDGYSESPFDESNSFLAAGRERCSAPDRESSTRCIEIQVTRSRGFFSAGTETL